MDKKKIKHIAFEPVKEGGKRLKSVYLLNQIIRQNKNKTKSQTKNLMA